MAIALNSQATTDRPHSTRARLRLRFEYEYRPSGGGTADSSSGAHQTNGPARRQCRLFVFDSQCLLFFACNDESITTLCVIVCRRRQQVKPGVATAKLVCSGGKLCFVRPASASSESASASAPAVSAGERGRVLKSLMNVDCGC